MRWAPLRCETDRTSWVGLRSSMPEVATRLHGCARSRELLAEERRKRLPGAMEPHFDGGRRHRESARRFLRRQFFDVAKKQHFPVVVRQLVDAGPDDGAGF